MHKYLSKFFCICAGLWGHDVPVLAMKYIVIRKMQNSSEVCDGDKVKRSVSKYIHITKNSHKPEFTPVEDNAGPTQPQDMLGQPQTNSSLIPQLRAAETQPQDMLRQPQTDSSLIPQLRAAETQPQDMLGQPQTDSSLIPQLRAAEDLSLLCPIEIPISE